MDDKHTLPPHGYVLLHIAQGEVFVIGPYHTKEDVIRNGPGPCGKVGHRTAIIPMVFDVQNMVEDVIEGLGLVISIEDDEEPVQLARDYLN